MNKKVNLPTAESGIEYFQELEVISDVLIGRLLHKLTEQTKYGRTEIYQMKISLSLSPPHLKVFSLSITLEHSIQKREIHY